MDKVKCTIIQDILPLYVDNVVCEDTKELVDEHIKTCESCDRLIKKMKENIEIPNDRNLNMDDTNAIKNLKKRIKKKSLKRMSLIVGVMLIFMMGFVYFMLSQTLFALSIDVDNVECVTWDATYIAIESRAKSVDAGDYDKEKLSVHSYNGLKSNEEADYMNIYCHIKVKNKSLFSHYTVDAMVSDVKCFEENLLFSEAASSQVMNIIDAGEERVITVRLDLYINDMSEADIRKFVDGLQITVTVAGGESKKISLSKCENVTVECSLSE